MDLVKSLNIFLNKENIRGADIQNITYVIKREEGSNAILDEFWCNLLKKSCNDNVFSTKQFNNLLDSIRFSENDIKDFFDIECSSLDGNEEKIKNILNIKEEILGEKCNIKFDLLLRDALWGLNINSDNFYSEWKLICNKVDIVEKETHNKEITFVNYEQSFNGFSDCFQVDKDYENSNSDVIVAGNIIMNYV